MPKLIQLVILDGMLDNVDDNLIRECIMDALHEAAENRRKRMFKAYSDDNFKEYERLKEKARVMKALHGAMIGADNCIANQNVVQYECDCKDCTAFNDEMDRRIREGICGNIGACDGKVKFSRALGEDGNEYICESCGDKHCR